MRTILILAAIAAGCNACTLHRVSRTPEPPIVGAPPERFPAASGPGGAGIAAAGATTAWWSGLADPVLDALLREALRQNLDVAEAAARVRRSRAVARATGAALLPQAGLAGEVTYTDPAEGPSSSFETAGAVASWEVDLFGRIASRTRAAARDADAAADELAAVRLSVTAEGADAYFRALEQRLQIALLEEQREAARALVELTELRFAQGAASAVDVLQQRAQLAGIEALVPPARAELRRAENRLDVLLGRAADGADRVAAADYPALPDLPAVGVPAELLVRRPDLRALRARAVAGDYRIAAAVSERLPRLTLTGSYGYAGVFEPAGVVATAVASLFAPVVDFGARRAAVAEARAAREEAMAAFGRAYLQAIAEVDGVLYAEARKREEIALARRRVEALEATVAEARNRYVNGLSDYLPVLTAVEGLHEAQRELLAFRRELVGLRVALHRALGGPLPDRESEDAT